MASSSSSAAKPEESVKKKASWANTACDLLAITLIIGVLVSAAIIRDNFYQADKLCLEKILELGRTITPELQKHFTHCHGHTWVCHCRYLATLQQESPSLRDEL